MDAQSTERTEAAGTTRVERRGDREIVVTRWFDAPPHLVFRAWSQPELFQRWWVPRSFGMTLHACEMDVRTGGILALANCPDFDPNHFSETDDDQRLNRALTDPFEVGSVMKILTTTLLLDGGLLTPSEQAQQRLFRRALADAGVQPSQVGMIEGHGTGTRVGDPVELRSLISVYGTDSAPGAGPRLGSVKSNIGHTQAAAGALGLTKVLLAAEHQAIPPTLHVHDGWHEGIDGDGHGITLAETITAWPASEGRRIGSVSAFGMSGTNAHLIVAVPDVPEAAPC